MLQEQKEAVHSNLSRLNLSMKSRIIPQYTWLFVSLNFNPIIIAIKLSAESQREVYGEVLAMFEIAELL